MVLQYLNACLNNHSPKYLCALFELKNSNYNFRKSKLLDLKRPSSTKYGKNSFTYYGVKVWNSLSNEIKDVDDLHTFKNMVSGLNHLKSNRFYF